MPVGSTISKWTVSSYIHYWLGSLQRAFINLCHCVYQSELGFSLDCIPVCSVVRVLKQNLYIFASWRWSWQSLAVMHCLLTVHVTDTFYYDSLWPLLYGMWNHIDTSQLNTWRSELSLCWQHAMLFLLDKSSLNHSGNSAHWNWCWRSCWR